MLPPAALTADLVRRGRELGSVETRAPTYSSPEATPFLPEAPVYESVSENSPDQEPSETEIPSETVWEVQEPDHIVEPLVGRQSHSKAGTLLNDVISFLTIFAISYAVILVALVII